MRIVAEKNIYELLSREKKKKKRMASNFLEVADLSGIHGFTELPAVNFNTSSGLCTTDHYMNWDTIGMKC